MEYSKLRNFIIAAVISSEVRERGILKLPHYVSNSVTGLLSSDDKFVPVEIDTEKSAALIKDVFYDMEDAMSTVNFHDSLELGNLLHKNKVELMKELEKNGVDDNHSEFKVNTLQNELFKLCTIVNLDASLYDYFEYDQDEMPKFPGDHEENASTNDDLLSQKIDYQARIVCDGIIVKVQEIMNLL